MSKVGDYINNRMEELVDGYECSHEGKYLEIVKNEIVEKFKVQCVTQHCGSFDSCGYDLDCYAIAFINEDGILEIQDYQQESC